MGYIHTKMNENQKHRFQIKTKPLTQKDLEAFFRPRSQGGSAVNSDVEAEEVIEETVVAPGETEEPVQELVEAVEAPGETEEPVQELVEAVEAVTTKLRKRNQAPCVPCKCTVAGPCYGQQYSSQATLAVHTANKHGNPIEANEKRLHDNTIRATTQKRRRKEDPQWREYQRARMAAYRAK